MSMNSVFRTEITNARLWPRRQKLVTTWVVSFFKFISGLTSSSVVPNLPSIASELDIPQGALTLFPLSAYFLGYSVGLLVIGSLSETFGRLGTLQAANLIFIVFNTACGFSQTKTQIIVARTLSGFGGAGPLCVSGKTPTFLECSAQLSCLGYECLDADLYGQLGGGILNDCFTPEERTSMITIYALPTQISPAIGPILGTLCEVYLGWRWTFWMVSIVSVVLQCVCFLTVRETYRPVLERRADRKKQPQHGDSSPKRWQFMDAVRDDLQAVSGRIWTDLARPFKMLATHPVVMVIALYNGVTYGLQNLVIASLQKLWISRYHQSEILASLNYITLAVGCVCGAQAARPLNKWMYARLKARDSEGQGRPEFRIPMITVGSGLVPLSLLWYGWWAQALAFPLLPDLGVFVFAAGTVIILNCTSLYLVDAYKQHSASATGAVNVLRALSGFAFPLFSDRLYSALGYGWGNTVLAGISISLGWPLPFLLWKYGRRWRAGLAPDE